MLLIQSQLQLFMKVKFKANVQTCTFAGLLVSFTTHEHPTSTTSCQATAESNHVAFCNALQFAIL